MINPISGKSADDARHCREELYLHAKKKKTGRLDQNNTTSMEETWVALGDHILRR